MKRYTRIGDSNGVNLPLPNLTLAGVALASSSGMYVLVQAAGIATC